jgi:hypothetical protein
VAAETAVNEPPQPEMTRDVVLPAISMSKPVSTRAKPAEVN